MKTDLITFWLTNISNRNISLADLNLTVNSFTSINLMDKKHYQYTIDQLQKSVTSGSIFSKRNKLVIRKIAPTILKMNIPLLKETFIETRARSIYSIKEENYEELNISDEQFAKDNADIVELDEKPLLKKV
jgi:hypothetical protein